jgi:prolycopene isomerase
MLEKQALSVPRGGSREVTGSFIRGLEKSGGILKLGREVTRIVVENGRAAGVECAGGESFSADVVISSAGIKRTLELAGEENFPGEYVEGVKGLEYSYSFITTKFGLDRRVIDAVAPCISTTPYLHPDHMFDYIDEGTAPVDPMLYVTIPTEWDEYAAPPGKQLVIMGVPGPIEATPGRIQQCEKILDRGEERLFELYPRVPAHIEWKMRYHIGHTAALTGKPTGECIGLAQSVGQTGRHKPSPKTPVEDLLLVGADAGGRGVGTEQASASAIYVAGLIG